MRSQIYGEFIALNQGGAWSLRCQSTKKTIHCAWNLRIIFGFHVFVPQITRENENKRILIYSNYLNVTRDKRRLAVLSVQLKAQSKHNHYFISCHACIRIYKRRIYKRDVWRNVRWEGVRENLFLKRQLGNKEKLALTQLSLLQAPTTGWCLYSSPATMWM